MRFTIAALLLVTAAGVAAQPGKRTYINPIDIDYRYNWEQINQGISYLSLIHI